MDLGVWISDGRYRPLLQLIDQLPGASRLREAILNDPEQAKILADGPEPDQPWRPLTRDMDLHAVLLREIHQILGSIYQSSEADRTEKRPPKVQPFPSPETEFDRVKTSKAEAEVDDFLHRLVPHQFA